MMFMPTMGNTLDGGGGRMDGIDITERTIRNDPRESFYWTLPNKLTPQQCLQMLRATLAGDLFQQFNLCQLMLDTWPTFRMASHQLMESAAYMRYAVHPYAEEGKKPSKAAVEKADVVSRAIRGMTPNPFNDEAGFSGMAYRLCDAMLNGLSLMELMWEQKASTNHGREWLPASAAWVHPRHYTFSTSGTIALYGSDSDRINSGVLGYRPGQQPDEDKFLCAQFVSKAGTSLGAGFMRPLVWYWSARQFNNEWMLNTAKQYGSPFIDITYKPGTVSTGPDSELSKLNEMLKTAGAQRRLLHPEGTTAEIHPPTSLGKENPQRVLEEKADEACLFLLLGQKGTTTAVSGQLGNDDSHENVKEERKLGLANWLARNPLRQFARAVLRRNYGNDDECPEIAPDTTKPLKPEQVGSMMTSVSGSGVPIRADEFYKKIGFTQPDEGEVVLVRGELMIQEAAMTKEDKFNEQLGQQVKQAEVQMELQGEQEQQQGVQAGERVRINVVRANNPEGINQWSAIAGKHGAKIEIKSERHHKVTGDLGEIDLRKGVGDGKWRMFQGKVSHGEVTPGLMHEEALKMASTSYSQSEHKRMLGVIGEGEDKDDIKSRDLSLRDALVHATDEELDKLEELVSAAETATHTNGEIKAVEQELETMTNRIKF